MIPSLTRTLRTLPAPLAGLDLAAACAEIEAALRRRGARTATVGGAGDPPTSVDLLLRHGPTPGAAIATFVLEGARIARAVVAHVRVAPLYAGVALVVHPRADLEAPLLVADLAVPPPGRARLFVDACGPAVASPGFDARFRGALAPIVDSARGLEHTPVPAWFAPLSGGCGGQLRAPRRGGETALRVLVRYLERYLDALESAPPAQDAAANAAAARRVGSTVRAHGRGGAYLTRTFGADFAAAHGRLFWNDP